MRDLLTPRYWDGLYRCCLQWRLIWPCKCTVWFTKSMNTGDGRLVYFLAVTWKRAEFRYTMTTVDIVTNILREGNLSNWKCQHWWPSCRIPQRARGQPDLASATLYVDCSTMKQGSSRGLWTQCRKGIWDVVLIEKPAFRREQDFQIHFTL